MAEDTTQDQDQDQPADSPASTDYQPSVPVPSLAVEAPVWVAEELPEQREQLDEPEAPSAEETG